MTKPGIWLVFGTRPEAIKLAPVHRALRESRQFAPVVCVTAQHREMLDHVLDVFDIKPDFDLDLMSHDQSLCEIAGRAVSGLGEIFREKRPDMVLVQGDTTTTFIATLAAFYNTIPVGHVEAGLRTGRLRDPFPEEANRILTSRLADLHFAPMKRAAEALIREGVPESAVHVTGNTVVDALFQALKKPLQGDPGWREPAAGKRLILVTAHRRESFGKPLESIFAALRRIAARGDVEIIVPVHPNPNVRKRAGEILGGVAGIQLLGPLPYQSFVHLMRRAFLILTDSGGIQEEAPSLGVPVLVLREITERLEATEAGVARVVGTGQETIEREVGRLLDDRTAYAGMARRENPFGDGQSARRIVDILGRYFA